MSFRRKLLIATDYLDRTPVRCVECEAGEGGCVTLLRPKFPKGLLAKWVQPRLARPYYRVKLDEIGSAVWILADGSRTIRQIATEIELRFGDRVRPADARVASFVRELDRGAMVTLR